MYSGVIQKYIMSSYSDSCTPYLVTICAEKGRASFVFHCRPHPWWWTFLQVEIRFWSTSTPRPLILYSGQDWQNNNSKNKKPNFWGKEFFNFFLHGEKENFEEYFQNLASAELIFPTLINYLVGKCWNCPWTTVCHLLDAWNAGDTNVIVELVHDTQYIAMCKCEIRETTNELQVSATL